MLKGFGMDWKEWEIWENGDGMELGLNGKK